MLLGKCNSMESYPFMGHKESHHFSNLRESKSPSRLDRAKLDELNHIFNQRLLNKVVKIQDQHSSVRLLVFFEIGESFQSKFCVPTELKVGPLVIHGSYIPYKWRTKKTGLPGVISPLFSGSYNYPITGCRGGTPPWTKHRLICHDGFREMHISRNPSHNSYPHWN